MKYNLNQIKKTEQVIFKAMQEIPADKIAITELTNDITNDKIYFLIHEGKANIDITFLNPEDVIHISIDFTCHLIIEYIIMF